MTDPIVVSRIGVHSTGARRDNWDVFMARILASGRMLAGVKCTNDFGCAYSARRVFPNILTIGRYSEYENDVDISRSASSEALRFFNRMRPLWARNPHIAVWETNNEWNGDYVWQADFYIALMDIGQPLGFKFGHWCSASGTPQYPELDPVPYPQLARVARRAQDGGHLMCFHEYGGLNANIFRRALHALKSLQPGDTLQESAPHNALRFIRVIKYLRSLGITAKIAITEAGQAGGSAFIGINPFMVDIAWYDQFLMQYPEVVCANMWTLGGGGWGPANFQTALPRLGEYIATVSPVVVPPPPTPMVGFAGQIPAVATDVLKSFVIDHGGTIKYYTQVLDA